MSKVKLLLPLGFFMILLMGLVSHFIAPTRAVSEMENRALEQFPLNPTKSELLSGDWSSKLESYFSDQFPKREMWMKNYVRSQMLMGKTYINDKYYYDEKSGWITTKPADLQNKKTLQLVTDKVAKLNEELKALNIPFTFFSFPAKATYIRTPHPSYMPEDNGLENNRIFLKMLQEKGVDQVKLMDSIKVFTDDQLDVHELYFKTDHHWNIHGAFKGYQAMVQVLSDKMDIAITPLTQDELEYFCLPQDFAGSWNKFYHMLLPTDDKICYLESPEFNQQRITMKRADKIEHVTRDEIYALGKNSSPEESINFSVGYSSDFGILSITNDLYDANEHILVLKDSYFNPIQFHFASHFKQTTIIDLRYFEGDLTTYINELGPSHVLMAYNDRNFDLGFQ